MTQEEKAKRYDEAIERAKAYQGLRSEMEIIFPELKESEDERVLKIIKETLKSYYSGIIFGSLSARDYADCLAWIEKQDKKKSIDDLTQKEAMDIAFAKCFEWDEQKPTDNVEPKFKVGDIIKPKCYNETHSIKAIGERYYILDVDIKIPFRDEDDWELVEQNHAWSEEDEQYLLVCKNALAKYQTTDKWDACIISHWLENKLKSLRPQKQWKPSEEQMKALEDAIEFLGCTKKVRNDLKSLYEQLKKLREEKL